MAKSSIGKIESYEILDSRGFPTVACIVHLQNGSVGSSSVPSGASTGEYEAHELRDHDQTRYFGKGVLKAVSNIENEISSAIKGMDVSNLEAIDNRMIDCDGTLNKSRLGANSILAVSLACAHAAANFANKPLFQLLGGSDACLLPVPLVNVINGGAHAVNSIDLQEFMLVPHGAKTFADSIRMASEIFHTLKSSFVSQKLSVGVGDEGGFAPNLPSAERALDELVNAISKAGYKPGVDISIALDVAASEFYDNESNSYILKKSSGEKLTASQLIALYRNWIDTYPIVSIEDGLDENDWSGWQKLTSELGAKVQLVGDDLFVTNTTRLEKGIELAAGNAILIKLNQIGTLTETLAAITLAKQQGFRCVISHRSGETEDYTISDLAVATGAGQIKTGSTCRSERTIKYNRLLWIEKYLQQKAHFNDPFCKA